MATIQAIEGRTIHQIQSGQVIVDLTSVVKELVENSLDAGATSIEVRFKNQGIDSIEVQDNGGGITSANYETVALKHYTSKLSTYADLNELQTFGFRGEALSSLCALSNFTIVTCTAEDAPKGTKLEFETSGKLKGTSVVAAQRGTTVSVENLFHNLPVRRRELERNIKREWTKVMQHLGAYACIQTGVKITVTQQAAGKNGKKASVFSTKGNKTTRENIANVFGAKTLSALIALDLALELQPTNTLLHRQTPGHDPDAVHTIRITGHVSRPLNGEGRQTPDRQMFFVNSRPCLLPQFAKTFNEVYRQYNSNQSPFIFANIELDTHLYDVNVSPDKRTILLHEQGAMLAELKDKLIELFEAQEYVVPSSTVGTQRQTPFKQLTLKPVTTPRDSPAVRERSATAEAEENGETIPENQQNDEEQIPAVTRAAVDIPPASIHLVDKWHNAQTTDRAVRRASRGTGGRIPEAKDAKLAFIDKFTRGTAAPQFSEPDEDADEAQEDEAAPAADDEAPTPSHIPVPSQSGIPIPVRDFNARLAEASSHSPPAPGAPIFATPRPDREEPIPSVSPIKPITSGGIISIISKRPMGRRLSEEEVTITIGSKTVTSTIGTPSKRPRVESQRAKNPNAASFGSKLSQRFGAPGTREGSEGVDGEDEYVEGEGEEEEEEEDDRPDEDEEDDRPDEDEENHPQATQDAANAMVSYDQGHAPAKSDRIITSFTTGASGADDAAQEESMFVSDAETDAAGEAEAEASDDEYIDEAEKKAIEDAKVASLIEAAELEAALPSQEQIKRTTSALKPNGGKSKNATVHLAKTVSVRTESLGEQMAKLAALMDTASTTDDISPAYAGGLAAANAEERLSLTISKSDFERMHIVGQFNLGFILAVRHGSASASSGSGSGSGSSDDLFIIDQHASDEKYNFETLQAKTVVQSQRLVRPKILDLTALEEEVLIERMDAVTANGFQVEVDPDAMVGQRCSLVSLPLSHSTVFDTRDLEELVSLLADAPPGHIPRPSKVRKMFAMRACRSSIMIGRTLDKRTMERVVRQMGGLEKPWNCPHGRPTMRHLAGLGVWEEGGWREGAWARMDGEESLGPGERGEEVDLGLWVKDQRG